MTAKPSTEKLVASLGKEKATRPICDTKGGRYTLDWWKCYLDSCASYHTFFVRGFLKNMGEDSSTMTGNCNAGTVLLKEKGWYKNF